MSLDECCDSRSVGATMVTAGYSPQGIPFDKEEDRSVPLALKYSVFWISSIDSKASASSLANACSSSYSPGRPMRSRKIRPEVV